MSKKRVVVIGDVMLDVVVQPLGSVAPTSDTKANVRVTRGGSGANLAIALRETGHDVTYIGASGNDAARLVFLDALGSGGIDTRIQMVDATTGTVVAIISVDGQRAMLTDRGANSKLDRSFVVEQLDAPFDHLHVSGYVFLDETTRLLAVDALAIAHSRGASTSVDVCSVAPLFTTTSEVFLESVLGASMLFANEEEALALSDASEVDAAFEVLAPKFPEVVITRGVQGVIASVGNERAHAPTQAIGVLDTTGAGDAATGAYLGARLNGAGLARSLELAMEASARVVGGLGALG